MFVRTRPKDNARVVVTKLEAEQIEEDWAIHSGTHEVYLAKKTAFATEHQGLQRRFGGREPSKSDVEWGVLNKELLVHIRNHDWGFYRNTRFMMAECLRKERRFVEALETYCEVCYVDLNGPNNVGGFKGEAEILKEFPPFDPTMASLAPGLIGLIQETAAKSSVDKDALKHMFIQRCGRLQSSLKTPLRPESCWGQLSKEL